MKKKRGSKQKSPASLPATQADVKRAKVQATADATRLCWAIFFRVLIDKHGATNEDLRKLWDEINDYSEAVASGEISRSDILDSLKQEDGVVVQV